MHTSLIPTYVVTLTLCVRIPASRPLRAGDIRRCQELAHVSNTVIKVRWTVSYTTWTRCLESMSGSCPLLRCSNALRVLNVFDRQYCIYPTLWIIRLKLQLLLYWYRIGINTGIVVTIWMDDHSGVNAPGAIPVSTGTPPQPQNDAGDVRRPFASQPVQRQMSL